MGTFNSVTLFILMSLMAYKVYYRKWPNLDIVKAKINDAFFMSISSGVISDKTLKEMDKVAHKVHSLMDYVRSECGSSTDPPYYDSTNMKWDRSR